MFHSILFAQKNSKKMKFHVGLISPKNVVVKHTI